MAKKITREAQYRDILEKGGIGWTDCRVIAFSFPKEKAPEILHFELMAPPRPRYYLFDAYGNNANIVIPKDDENERIICAIAERCGGERRTPNLLG